MGYAIVDNMDMFSSKKMNIGQGRVPGKSETFHEYVDLVKRRSTPDVIIMGKYDEILYLNHAEISPLTLLDQTNQDAEQVEAERKLKGLLGRLREAVLSRERLPAIERPMEAPTALFSFRGTTISFRGLLLKGTGLKQELVMILIEKIKNGVSTAPSPKPFPYFTPREKSVLVYIKKGYTNKEIACALNIGVHTVKDHLKRIMAKVGVRTRAGIAGKLNIAP